VAFLPESTNDQYRGARISAWFLVLNALLTLAPGVVHYVLPDGGAGVIAHMDLSTRAGTIIALFAWYGALQIPFGLIELIVGLRYRALVPLLLSMVVLQQTLSAVAAWFWKGGGHHPPEHYASAATAVLALLFLALALGNTPQRRKSLS
jgi:hypothetical protein